MICMASESKKGACSAHVEAAKANCLQHARREGQVPSYVNPHLTKNNRTIFEDEAIKGRKSIVPLKKRAELEYTQKTGQRCQKSFTPFREDVLVVKAGTRDEELLAFKAKVEKNTGWKVLGMWLHQDEGYARSKYIEGDANFKQNIHVHCLYDCQDHITGKAIRLDRNYFRLRQDWLAAATGMERGNPASMTGRKHRRSAEERKQAEEARIEKLAEVAGNKEVAITAMEGEIREKMDTLADINQNIVERTDRMKNNALNTLDKVLSLFGQSEKDEKIRNLGEEVKSLNFTIGKRQEETKRMLDEAVKRAEQAQRQVYQRIINALEKDNSALRSSALQKSSENANLKKKLSAYEGWLGDALDLIKIAVRAIVENTANPKCKHFSQSQIEVIDEALGKDAAIDTRKNRAQTLLTLAETQLHEQHVPAAWVASTSSEVMGIADGKDNGMERHTAPVVRR